MNLAVYVNRIDTTRKAVAASFTVCGMGFVAAANVGYEGMRTVLGIGTFLSLIAAFGLFVEYLVRARLKPRSGQSPAYQFTLAQMMVAMVPVAVVLGMFRILGWWTLWPLILAVLLFACGDELVRLGPRTDDIRKSPNDAPVAVQPPNAPLQHDTRSDGHATKG